MTRRARTRTSSARNALAALLVLGALPLSGSAEDAVSWSLEPIHRVAPPRAERAEWTRQPLDRFVLAHLEAAGLEPSPEAAPDVLVRRVVFDLSGLPPEPAEIDAFAARSRLVGTSRAWDELVDRLLASPRFGERQARRWLDLVRFGESHGFEYNEPRDTAWPYRDWVIEALDADLPYDEFVRMQLAGDVLTPETADGVVAAGFLVAGAHNTTLPASATMRATMRQDAMEDLIAVVGQSFLGLTIHCGRCHDHKFDPITQRDYYSIAAALAGVGHGERELPAARDAELPAKVWTVVPAKPGSTRVLARGSVSSPGDEVTAGGVRALVSVDADFGLAPDAPDAARRTRLAAWITHRDNPLFARVIVNRIWQHHFGHGIVDTPSDLGVNGAPPSHPDLLDWLAAELIRHEWSLKWLHRTIVTSAAYRQASAPVERALRVDAENRLLWRFSPRRLEAEEIRDTLLDVAGLLDRRRGGPGYQDVSRSKFGGSTFYEPIEQDRPELFRRTIYRFTPRGASAPILDTFDCPDPSATAPKRAVTTTPLQALALLNASFVLQVAERFAARLEREVGSSLDEQLALAHRLAYGREVDADGAAAAAEFVAEHGMAAYCRVLFNTNEFLHVR